MTGGIAPSPNGRGYARIPGLWSDAQLNAWKAVTHAVHAEGGKIVVQIMHTGRVSHPANMPAGAKIVAREAAAAMGAPVVPRTFKQALRKAWPRTFFLGGRFDLTSCRQAVNDGVIDLIGTGRAILANPDLVHRFKKGLALNVADASAFFMPGPKGYTDYPVAVV